VSIVESSDRERLVSTAIDVLPIRETQEPDCQQAVIEAINDCYALETPVYPIGGGTSLGYGLPPRDEGIGLSVGGLNCVVDYPARDMTITVEAGITMERLAATLAEEGQRLPVDVPHAARATLGGVVATNTNGPRRYGQGVLRDYVIGISAVDGQGMPYKGGGRVVKNVAGYDFCKLLTGSLGTLGIITQLTVRVKPIPERTAFLCCTMKDLDEAEKLLSALTYSEVTPTMIELLCGPAWQEDAACPLASDGGDDCIQLAVGLEGMDAEVSWMMEQLGREWDELGVGSHQSLDQEDADRLMACLVEFPDGSDAPLVLQASVLPSQTTRFMAAALSVDRRCSIQAHAGNGMVILRMSEISARALSKALAGKLQPAAREANGNIVMLSNTSGAEMSRQSVWGARRAPYSLMSEIKRRFDPKNLLNRGRFVYDQ
jgi:glycolate oxidase FAD binding subunit